MPTDVPIRGRAPEPARPAAAGEFAEARVVEDPRHHAREALGERRFRSLIEHATDVVCILDRAGTLEYVTPSVRRVLGHCPEQLLGASAFGLLHPDDAPEAIQRFTRMAGSGARCEGPLEVRVRHPTTGWRILEVRTNNLLLDPSVSGVVIHARDVTDERRALQAQHRLGSFLEATPDLVATFDPFGRALSINAAFREMVGLGPDTDLSAVTLSDLYPHEVTQLLRDEGIPSAIRTGIWTGEARLTRRNGEAVVISQMVLAHRAASGEVEFLSMLARDITEQKRAELALRRSEAHFRSLIENAHDIIAVLDADRRIRYMSPAGQRILGHGEEMVGAEIGEFLSAEDQPALSRAFEELLRHAGTVVAVELRFHHRDGSWRVLEAVGTNLLDDPAVAGIVVNARDVTERRRAEEALVESQEQLLQSQKMEAIGRLAGGVAHDFNNLLTAIKGFTELLLLEFGDPDPRSVYATEIQSAANRAAALTRQLLAFSRKQVLRPRVLDLSASVRGMEPMLRRLIGEDVRLETELAPGLGGVRADPGQIEQVLLNLVVNARDAMPRGGRLGVQTFETELPSPLPDGSPGGAFVALRVEDTGCGMSDDIPDRIFEPFFTTKEQGRGTGLGLSTVYGIVRQSGGWIDVESELGRGSVFTVYLPRVEEAPEAVPERVAVQVAAGSETILLVEDELPVRVLVRNVLARMGYRVIEAESGAAALDLVRDLREPIHLLLTDIVMPGMSGRELADTLLARVPGVRLLFMSGYTERAIADRGVLHPERVLEKPFAMETLLRTVREVLDDPLR